MKLNGYFCNGFALALVGEPGMVNIGAYKYQFQVINNFNVAANYPFCPFGIKDKIKLIFIMIMQGKIELFLFSRKNCETIARS